MTDIATLGLAIDSSPVERARDELGRFASAAKAAEAGAKAFEQSTAKAGQAAQGLGKNIQAALNSAEQINKRLNVRDSFAGPERAADVAAYGQELDRLRAKINPVFAAQQAYRTQVDEIAMAVRVGAISEQEKTAALLRAEQAYAKTTKAITLNEQQIMKTGKAALVSSYQYQNLAFQLNDVVTMATMGMDPLRILTSQAGQFYQILAMTEGGVRASLREIGAAFMGLLTPMNVVIAAVGAFSAAALAAAVSWDSAQRQVRLALIGVGGAAGLTAEDITDISFAANASGQATVGAARDMALAFAATGKIGKDVTTELVGLGRDVAAVYGEDLPEAADRLAAAFADPAKGVLDLNKRLGAFDDITVQNIRTLALHGDRLEAQRLLIDGLKNSIDGAANSTNVWSRSWTNLVDTTSGWWARFGQRIDRVLGGGSIKEQIEDTEQLIRSLKSQDFFGTQGPRIAEAEAKLRALNEQLEITAQRAHDADVNLRAMAAVDIASRISPTNNQLSTLSGDLSTLKRALADQELMNTLTDANRETLERSIQVLQTKIRWHKTDFEIAMERSKFDQRESAARTVADKAELEFDRTLAQLRRQGVTEVEAIILATQARLKVMKDADEQAKQWAREQAFEHEQTVSRMELETELIGKTAAEAAGLRAEWEAVAEAKRRAFEEGRTSVSEDELRNAAQIGVDVRGATLRREGRELERDQMTPSEQLAEEMRRLDELRNADLISHETYLGAKNAAEYQAFQSTQQILANERSMREQTFNLAAGLLDQFAGKSKAAAIAAIALNKSVQIANVIVNTISASAAALAPPPLGLGPVAGAPLAASIKAWGAVQVGLIAATGLAQAASAGKSSGGLSSQGGSGGAAPATPIETPVQATQQYRTINVIGSRFNRDDIMDLIDDINAAQADGSPLFRVGVA